VVIRTERLTLRHFTAADAPQVQRLAGAHEVAAATLLIPHPYPDGAADSWIAAQPERRAQGVETFAIEADGEVIGAIGLHIERDHDRAELGYWIGVPFWGRGYATEAARAIVDYGFATHRLRRIFAVHFANNRASGRVLQKIGMQHEGRMRAHAKKWGEYVDLEMYGVVR
jgi:ribosomal-protein-alanine N-acetyltransferase